MEANELLRERIRKWAEYFWITLGNPEVLALIDDPAKAVRLAADCADAMMDDCDTAAQRPKVRVTVAVTP